MKNQKATNVVWHAHIIKREEREKLLKQKNELIHMFAHDIKNPLMSPINLYH